jgi:hypothetical protein
MATVMTLTIPRTMAVIPDDLGMAMWRVMRSVTEKKNVVGVNVHSRRRGLVTAMATADQAETEGAE